LHLHLEFRALPPGVVSGFPNITPTFSRIWLINIAVVLDLEIAPDNFLNAVDIVVVDSVAALTPKAEIEGEMGDTHVGLQARLMSQALRKEF
jgi:hypothetical protein